MEGSSPSPTTSKRKQPGHVHFKDPKNEENHQNDIDPDTLRDIPLPLSNIEAFLHLLKSLVGTGILAMPRAFLYAGWMIGIIGTALIACTTTYCVHLLVKCQYELCKRHRKGTMSYSEAARRSLPEGPHCCSRFGKVFGFLTNMFLVMDQIGACCIYIIFVASNLKEVLDIYIQPLDIRLYMVCLLPPLLLLNYIRNLKYLTPFSTVANLIMAVSIGITFYYVFSDLPSISERKSIGSVKDMPLFMGMVFFSIEAIGLMLPLRNDMKNPKSFGGLCGILNIVMVILTVSYITVGFFGYLKYGDKTRGSITLNLPGGDGLAQSVRIMLSCSVLLSHALQCYVIIDVIWNKNLAHTFFRNRWKLWLEYVTRTLIVVLTVVLAVAIPNLEIFISLVGALCGTLLCVLFPVIMETSTFWNTVSGPRFYFMCIKNILLGLFGLSALLIGIYTSLLEMFEVFF